MRFLALTLTGIVLAGFEGLSGPARAVPQGVTPVWVHSDLESWESYGTTVDTLVTTFSVSGNTVSLTTVTDRFDTTSQSGPCQVDIDLNHDPIAHLECTIPAQRVNFSLPIWNGVRDDLTFTFFYTAEWVAGYNEAGFGNPHVKFQTWAKRLSNNVDKYNFTVNWDIPDEALRPYSHEAQAWTETCPVAYRFVALVTTPDGLFRSLIQRDIGC